MPENNEGIHSYTANVENNQRDRIEGESMDS